MTKELIARQVSVDAGWRTVRSGGKVYRSPMDQRDLISAREDAVETPASGSQSPVAARAVAAPAWPPTVPDYDLLRRVGNGAYGEVWLARSQATGARRAAKIVWRSRFEDERESKER